MALRTLLTIGHPHLRAPASPLSRDDLTAASTQANIDDLIETMRNANGAGLAAVQIDWPARVCAIEVSHNPRYPYLPPVPLTVLVNPTLVATTTDTFGNMEGCLSVPNLRGEVLRYAGVRVRAWDRTGRDLDFTVAGLTAGTFQHEIDHLDGRLFIDRVIDPKTLCTLSDFDRFHRERTMQRAHDVLAKYR